MKTTASSTTCAPSTEEEYVLPCAEALLAGTLALMTAYAQGSASCPGRPVMASQLVSNLIRLSHHPAFTPTMHTVLNRLCGSWQQQVTGNAPTMPTPPPTPLWHGTPQAVQ
jgi:hypothetical protein